MKINQAYYEEAKERKGQLNLMTVMAAEGKSPLTGPIIEIPKRHDVNLWDLDDVVDEHEWVRIPVLDAHMVFIAKINGRVHFLINDGSTCLSQPEPGIRKAHWYLSSKFHQAVSRDVENNWVIGGFWTLYANKSIYNFPTPFQVFEIINCSGNILPYNYMKMWCDTLGMDLCPTVERDEPPSDVFPDDDAYSYHTVICRKESTLPDTVSERFMWTWPESEIIHRKSLATSRMPYGLIQHELPRLSMPQTRLISVLKQLGLPC